MADKKRVELTKTEDRILKAVKTIMNKAPEGRARKLHSAVCVFLDEQREKVSTAMVRIFIEWMASEKLLVEIARDMPAGDKVISILYEFNEEAYKAREFVVVTRRKVSIYPHAGKKKPIEEVAQPDEKKGERPGFDVWAVYDGAKKLLAEKRARYEELLVELATLKEEVDSLQGMTGSFETSLERMKKVVG